MNLAVNSAFPPLCGSGELCWMSVVYLLIRPLLDTWHEPGGTDRNAILRLLKAFGLSKIVVFKD